MLTWIFSLPSFIIYQIYLLPVYNYCNARIYIRPAITRARASLFSSYYILLLLLITYLKLTIFTHPYSMHNIYAYNDYVFLFCRSSTLRRSRARDLPHHHSIPRILYIACVYKLILILDKALVIGLAHYA